jgi:hypothetical protein
MSEPIGEVILVLAAMGVVCGPVGWLLMNWGRYVGENVSASTRWPTVRGRVLWSDAQPASGLGEDVGAPIVRYEYEVDNVRYESFTIRFDVERPDAYTARMFAKTYPAGTRITVHYDPRDPQVAALEVPSRVGWRYWVGLTLIALPFMAAAIYVLVRLT